MAPRRVKSKVLLMSVPEGFRLASEFVLPKCSATTFRLQTGQRFRVIAHEGKQVADVKFFNADDLKEQFAATWSILLNTAEGVGDDKPLAKLWSKPPYE